MDLNKQLMQYEAGLEKVAKVDDREHVLLDPDMSRPCTLFHRP